MGNSVKWKPSYGFPPQPGLRKKPSSTACERTTERERHTLTRTPLSSPSLCSILLSSPFMSSRKPSSWISTSLLSLPIRSFSSSVRLASPSAPSTEWSGSIGEGMNVGLVRGDELVGREWEDARWTIGLALCRVGEACGEVLGRWEIPRDV